MAQLIEQDGHFTHASGYVIEAGSGTIVFNPGEADERIARIESLSLPLIVPSTETIAVEGSSILFYVTGSTPTDDSVAANQMDDVRTSSFSLTEAQSAVVSGGRGKFRYIHTNNGVEETNLLIDTSDMNFPFEVSLGTPAGTNTVQLVPQGSGSSLLTSDAVTFP